MRRYVDVSLRSLLALMFQTYREGHLSIEHDCIGMWLDRFLTDEEVEDFLITRKEDMREKERKIIVEYFIPNYCWENLKDAH